MTQKTELEQRDLFYRGYVQGVGFRYNTRAIARQFQVTGFVQNLPDGRVHLVVEGLRPEVRAFLEQVADRLGRFIHGVDEDERPATGQFTDFDIR